MNYGTFVEADGELSREITFLARAVCKENEENRCRRNMHRILIEPSEVEPGKLCGVTTDGRRLHLVDPLTCPDEIGLKPGKWRPLKMGGETAWIAQVKENKGIFPPYRKVIPQSKPLFTFELHGLPRGDMMGNMPYLVNFFREFPEPTAINMNYLNSLDHYRDWEVKWYGSNDAVLFESDNYTAVIMPMRMERTW